VVTQCHELARKAVSECMSERVDKDASVNEWREIAQKARSNAEMQRRRTRASTRGMIARGAGVSNREMTTKGAGESIRGLPTKGAGASTRGMTTNDAEASTRGMTTRGAGASTREMIGRGAGLCTDRDQPLASQSAFETFPLSTLSQQHHRRLQDHRGEVMVTGPQAPH
jgi:hypothetical protein